MNWSMYTADRTTHLKIVVVGLAAALLIAVIGIAARDFDMLTMPEALRERVPTANFFQRQGYERNPVARRTGVVAKLIADIDTKMTRGAHSAGAKDMAAAF